MNTAANDGENTPSAAGLPGGGFVVVWRAFSPSSIAGRRIDAAGTLLGAELQIAPQSAYGVAPDVASDRRGRFVVAWSQVETAGGFGIAARRFDVSSAPQGSAFAVNTYSTGNQQTPAVAMQRGGAFVVVWTSQAQDGSGFGVFGQRFDGAGQRAGAEFRVNTFTSSDQIEPSVAADEAGRFVVAWQSYGQDGSRAGVFAQAFQADGTRSGAEFQVSTQTQGEQYSPHVLAAPGGEFTVVWREAQALWSRRFDAAGQPQGAPVPLHSLPIPGVVTSDAVASPGGDFTVAWDAPGYNAVGRRFDASGIARGAEFMANATTSTGIPYVDVGSDASGNLLVTWAGFRSAADSDIYARRYGGLVPVSTLTVDGGNNVLEPGEAFSLRSAWGNLSGATQAFQGRSSELSAPPGLTLTLSSDADYGTVPNGTSHFCNAPCFAGSLSGTRPPGHVDASFLERIVPDAQGQSRKWVLHVGDSFADVPRSNAAYVYVETVLHHGLTGGCAAGQFCPGSATTREQMAPVLLLAKEGSDYQPPACGTPAFADVPAASPFCRWIEELARRGVVGGCAPGLYCPSAAVTREQMAVFVLRTLDPALNPPACVAGAEVFADVPASSAFCRWIEELVRRGVVTGCGGGNYCPGAPVTREQMSVFLTVTFGLTLYGP